MKIVFDIGGTNIRVAVAEDNKVVRVEKESTPADPADAVDLFEAMAKKVSAGGSVDGIAGGIAGVIEKSGHIKGSPNLSQWVGSPFVQEISKRFGVQVSVYNDAALAGLGEAVFGAGRGHSIVAYIGAGTGIGGARVVNGSIDSYAQGFEPGSQIVDYKEGIELEELISGSAIKRKHKVHPTDLGEAGYDAMTPIFALGIHNCVALWSPHVVVLGGSLMNEGNGYRLARVKSAFEKIPHRFQSFPEIKIAQLKDEMGLYGGLALLNKK
jgi:predicted NBD/HSP70 family sugar kinase